MQQITKQPIILIAQILLLCSLAHQFFAGIRFLLIDAEIGVDKSQARIGAWLVFLAGLITVIVIIARVCL